VWSTAAEHGRSTRVAH